MPPVQAATIDAQSPPQEGPDRPKLPGKSGTLPFDSTTTTSGVVDKRGFRVLGLFFPISPIAVTAKIFVKKTDGSQKAEMTQIGDITIGASAVSFSTALLAEWPEFEIELNANQGANYTPEYHLA